MLHKEGENEHGLLPITKSEGRSAPEFFWITHAQVSSFRRKFDQVLTNYAHEMLAYDCPKHELSGPIFGIWAVEKTKFGLITQKNLTIGNS